MLKVQALTKFCHIAESLGATALAFKTSYDDASTEIVGLYKTISNYEVKQIKNFYNEIKDREDDYIAKIFGHPPLSVQEKQTKDLLELSCRNVRDDFNNIGNLYLELEPMYNAYKHGYRLLFGKDDKDGSDTVVFIVKGGNENHISLENALVANARNLVYKCRVLLDCILENHRIRLEYEGADYNIFPTANRVHTDETGKKIAQQKLILDASHKQTVPLNLLFTTRGQKLKEEKQLGNLIFESFKHTFQEDDQGKFVAIDIDNKKIIVKDVDIQSIISSVHQSEITSRIFIRKIGDDSVTDIKIY